MNMNKWIRMVAMCSIMVGISCAAQQEKNNLRQDMEQLKRVTKILTVSMVLNGISVAVVGGTAADQKILAAHLSPLAYKAAYGYWGITSAAAIASCYKWVRLLSKFDALRAKPFHTRTEQAVLSEFTTTVAIAMAAGAGASVSVVILGHVLVQRLKK